MRFTVVPVLLIVANLSYLVWSTVVVSNYKGDAHLRDVALFMICAWALITGFVIAGTIGYFINEDRRVDDHILKFQLSELIIFLCYSILFKTVPDYHLSDFFDKTIVYYCCFIVYCLVQLLDKKYSKGDDVIGLSFLSKLIPLYKLCYLIASIVVLSIMHRYYNDELCYITWGFSLVMTISYLLSLLIVLCWSNAIYGMAVPDSMMIFVTNSKKDLTLLLLNTFIGMGWGLLMMMGYLFVLPYCEYDILGQFLLIQLAYHLTSVVCYFSMFVDKKLIYQ